PGVGRSPPRVTAPGLLERGSQRNPPRPEQHDRVEPEIRHLLDEAPVALAAEGRRHHLHRLLADLPADRRLARGQQPADVRTGRRRALARLDDGLEPGQHVRAWFRGPVLAARRERAEEAGALTCVARGAVRVHLDEERVGVAVDPYALDVLRVARALALAPEGLAGARPEVGEPG